MSALGWPATRWTSNGGLREFFALAQERYMIRTRRRGGYSEPWTDDPVLQRYRFCNVHREHDRTTVWFRENVREPLDRCAKPVELILATIGFRWFNRVETGEKLLPMFLERGWDSDWARELLRDHEGPLVTGAYMIKTPARMNKLEGIIECMDRVPFTSGVLELGGTSLKAAHTILTRVPFLGGFMAYEIVSDLRWTCLLEGAPDILDWCHLGPGGARGIEWVTGARYNRNSRLDQDSMQRVCQRLLALARDTDADLWPGTWRPWEMREVEHWLCEHDKWCRATYRGQSLKRRFDNATHQPIP